MTKVIDAGAELAAIREHRVLAKKTHYRRSKLDPWRHQIVALRSVGASCADIVHWLQFEQRRKVSASSVGRYLQRLVKLQILDLEAAYVKSDSQL